MTHRRIPTIELQPEDRALHEDFKRLAQLSAARTFARPLAATIRLERPETRPENEGQTEVLIEATCVEVSNESIGLVLPASAQPALGDSLEVIALRQHTEV